MRDRCGTSYDLASLFHDRRNTLDRWSGKIAKLTDTKLRRSRRIATVSMLSSSKTEEVSQYCCVFELSSSKIEDVSQNSLAFKLADSYIDRYR